MKKIVCEMCDCTEFIKENGLFVCQGCGCKYSVEEAKKMMVEVGEESEEVDVEEEEEQATRRSSDPRDGYTKHVPGSSNKIWVSVEKVGHEVIDNSAISMFSALSSEVPMKFIEGPDHLGRIGAEIKVKNVSGKSIKYITVYLTPYNEVGDEVFCTIGSRSTYGIEITGPFAVGESWNGYSDGMWYNLTIVSARVEYVTVDYMDGTKEWFDEADIHAGMVNVTVAFDSNLGGAGLLAYDLDGERQAVIPRGQSATHQMSQGTHTLTIKSLLLGKEYTFTAQSDTTIDVYGKSFGFDITER